MKIKSKKTILISGGAGYIGSHTSIDLLSHGYRVVVLDDFSNSSQNVVERIRKISKCAKDDLLSFKADIRFMKEIEVVFENCAKNNINIDGVIHFAALKAAGESVKYPLDFYEVNVAGSLNLVKIMEKYKCGNIIFSSSACVYGNDNQICYEDTPTNPINPYGTTKLVIENFLKEYSNSRVGEFKAISLRYFNVIGSHSSGEIGEDPQGIPTNLFPVIQEVISGKRAELKVFGSDYKTPDGTAVRDYIDVRDISQGHILALEYLFKKEITYDVFNLGTGKGSSVKDIIFAFEQVLKAPIPHKMAERRQGDAEMITANVLKAQNILGFKAKYSILDSCKTSVQWVNKYPNGLN